MDRQARIEHIESSGGKHKEERDGLDGFQVKAGLRDAVIKAAGPDDVRLVEYRPGATPGDILAHLIGGPHGMSGRWFSCYVWVEIQDN